MFAYSAFLARGGLRILAAALFVLLAVVPAPVAVRAHSTNGISDVDEATLLTHLQILSTASISESGDICNNIFAKTVYTTADWVDFFTRYFNQYPFTIKLWEYLTWPGFWAIPAAEQVKLQKSVALVMQAKLTAMTAGAGDRLGERLGSDAAFRETYLNAHRWMADIALNGKLGSTDRQAIADFYKDYVAASPQYWTKVRVDVYDQPYVALIAAQVHANLRSLLPVSEERKQAVAEQLKLPGIYRTIWDKFSVLLLDNNSFDAPQLQFLYDFLDGLPGPLVLADSISAADFLYQPGQATLPTLISGVNVFSTRVGQWTENPFPNDIPGKLCDGFVEVVAHEVNHPVFAKYIEPDTQRNNRFHELIERAGRDPANYLRNGGEGFFYSTFYEYFASISNQWFCDSAQVFDLGMARYAQGRTHPLDHAVYYADIYSLGSDTTWFYATDLDGSLTKYPVTLHRNERGHIEQIDLPDGPLYFTLDEQGRVILAGYGLPELSAEFPTQVSVAVAPKEEYRHQVTITNTGQMDLLLSSETLNEQVFGGVLDMRVKAGVVVPNHSSLNPTNTITIEAWIKPRSWQNGTTNNGRILQKGAADNQYRLTVENGGLLFELQPMGQLRIDNWLPPLETWTHLAAVYTGEKMILYVNGEVKAERAASGKIATSTDALYIGNKNDMLIDGFIGQIDEVRIWAQVRYPVEIVRDMHLWSRGDEGGLRGYWRFDRPGQSSVLDSSENANHGQRVGPVNQVKGSAPAAWVMWQVGDRVLVPGEQQTIDLVVFPATLPDGSYAADAVLHSSDPLRAVVRVPVQLRVGGQLILEHSLYLPNIGR